MEVYTLQGSLGVNQEWTDLATISCGKWEYGSLISRAIFHFVGVGWKRVRVLDNRNIVLVEFGSGT